MVHALVSVPDFWQASMGSYLMVLPVLVVGFVVGLLLVRAVTR